MSSLYKKIIIPPYFTAEERRFYWMIKWNKDKATITEKSGSKPIEKIEGIATLAVENLDPRDQRDRSITCKVKVIEVP